jgi:hypothetical protein
VSIDDTVWEMLRARAAGDRAGRGRLSAGRELPPESRARILDAAVEVLAATRHLVEALEEGLRERRDRLVAAPPDTPPPARSITPDPPERTRPGRIDLSY